MILHGTHITTYTYDAPVALDMHAVRLQPRHGGNQFLRRFSVTVSPTPTAQTQTLDAEGNPMHVFWFLGQTNELRIETRFEVKNTASNPFDFIPSPTATVPVQLPPDERDLLRPYFRCSPSAEISALAQRIAASCERSALNFVVAANTWIWKNIDVRTRPHGAALKPDTTLADGKGACRDKAVLLMELCRSQGIPARFVSGYLYTPDDEVTRHELHAWTEAWIPGGGWRAFDPTQGLATSEHHVALAASATPTLAAPVSGSFRGNAIAPLPEHAVEIVG